MTRLVSLAAARGLVALSLATLAVAQLTTSTARPSSSASASAAAPSTPAPAASGTASAPSLVSLHSSNPTAVPLSSIYSGATGQSTVPLATTATPGASSPVSGAPPVPSWAYTPGSFPALDLTPPTDSPEVKGWINDVKNSGIAIPGLTQSVTGGCSANAALAANTSRCWWTCGGCTRPSDVTTCPDKMTWGLSYDDGPSPYSTDLLNYLNSQKLTATFFIVGSRAISRPDILQAEYISGNQLSVHTWSHSYMTTLTNEQVIAELGWTKKAIKDITGVTPNTWRPPYGDVDDRVRAIAQAMGLTTIIWTSSNGVEYDTDDWHIPSGVPTSQVVNTFNNILNGAKNLSTGFIVLEHDLYQQTVDLAVGYVLPDALARQPPFTLKSIISCLNKPLSDAYIETNNNATNPVTAGATTLSVGATDALSSVSTRAGASGTSSAGASGTGKPSSGSLQRPVVGSGVGIVVVGIAIVMAGMVL